jgi:hypothetical protein
MVIKPVLLKIALGAIVCVLGILFAANPTSAKDTQARESVKAFLDHYFSTWSNGDLDAYKKCFHPKATIAFLDRTNTPRASFSLDVFIQTQIEAQRKSAVKMREIPLDKRIIIDGKLGQATVRWKLFKGAQTVTGIDLFTLISIAGEWKILHLAVHND